MLWMLMYDIGRTIHRRPYIQYSRIKDKRKTRYDIQQTAFKRQSPSRALSPLKMKRNKIPTRPNHRMLPNVIMDQGLKTVYNLKCLPEGNSWTEQDGLCFPQHRLWPGESGGHRWHPDVTAQYAGLWATWPKPGSRLQVMCAASSQSTMHERNCLDYPSSFSVAAGQ